MHVYIQGEWKTSSHTHHITAVGARHILVMVNKSYYYVYLKRAQMPLSLFMIKELAASKLAIAHVSRGK